MSDNGRHGNSTHGINSAIDRLHKGTDFTGQALEHYHAALDAYGYDEGDLVAMGTLGLIARKTARLSALSDLLWSALMGCAALGDVQGFLQIEKRYGHRLTQSLQADVRLLELQQQGGDVIDYEEMIASG